MEREPGNSQEVEGVLNPAAARGPDGHLYLFPRLVARGNYSRIGIARVNFNGGGNPIGVERLGIALEPEAEYELRYWRRRWLRRSADHLRRTDRSLRDDLHRVFAARSADRSGDVRRFVSLEAGWGSRGSLRIAESILSMSTIRTPVSSRSRLPTMPEKCSWRCSIGRCFQAPVPKIPPAATALARLMRTMRASGYPTVRCRCQGTIPNSWACSIHTTAWLVPVASWERLKIGAGTPPVLTRARLARDLPRRE